MIHLFFPSYNEESILVENFNHKKKFRLEGNTEYEKELYKIDNLLFKIPDPVGVGVDSNYRNNYYKHYFNLNIDEIEDGNIIISSNVEILNKIYPQNRNFNELTTKLEIQNLIEHSLFETSFSYEDIYFSKLKIIFRKLIC